MRFTGPTNELQSGPKAAVRSFKPKPVLAPSHQSRWMNVTSEPSHIHAWAYSLLSFFLPHARTKRFSSAWPWSPQPSLRRFRMETEMRQKWTRESKAFKSKQSLGVGKKHVSLFFLFFFFFQIKLLGFLKLASIGIWFSFARPLSHELSFFS